MKYNKGFVITFIGVFLFILTGSIVFASEPNITLEAENSDIVSVLSQVAAQAKSNLVISNSVEGKVTVSFNNVPLSKVLDAVIKSNNLIYTLEDDIINVYSYEEIKHKERFSRISTRVYTLKYADVADLRRVLLSMKSTRGRIELNEKANQVSVTDTQE